MIEKITRETLSSLTAHGVEFSVCREEGSEELPTQHKLRIVNKQGESFLVTALATTKEDLDSLIEMLTSARDKM